MKLYRFDAEVGKEITRDHSQFVLSRVLKMGANDGLHVGCMHLDGGGIVGYHQAVVPQLFIVVQGVGWVRGEEEEHTVIQAGQAAFWVPGEWHESGTDTGMMAIVIEGHGVGPEGIMPELK